MLTLWKPRNDLWRWNRDLDSYFGYSRSGYSFSPAVDIEEREDSFLLTADLPGMRREDIEVEIENNTLTLSGTRELGNEEKEGGYYRRERSYGSFSRSFRLGPGVVAGNIDATYENGVLRLTLPKAEEAKPQRIDIH